jgi:hypothetical protein
MTAVAASPAAAQGAGNVEFSVSGTLPTFPCPNGCFATFGGSGTGAGQLATTIGGVPYEATFTIVGGSVTGSASYTEPGFPFCPLIGSATNPSTGTITLSGGSTGIIYRTSSPTLTGTVTSTSFTLGYTYQRVGVTPAIVLTGGSVTVNYFFPGTGSGSFTKTIAAGAGTGVFVVDPVQAESHCLAPGPLGFTITGDAAAVVNA